MKNKKIFILLSSGVALRNFAFTSFSDLAKAQQIDLTFLNSTCFSIEEMGYDEIPLTQVKLHWFTDILKNARKEIELNLNIKKSGDTIYNVYRFPSKSKSLKSFLKNSITKIIITTNSSAKGLERIKQVIKNKERTTRYYTACVEILKREKPDFLFCTNQRIVTAIAPILAAQDLKIPTATFIFSWDNLPKATLVVDTDYYFVWSDFMKKEMLNYYPEIKNHQVIVTGTPQFESHFDSKVIKPKEVFYKEHHLDINKKYICFSGDDITTSPDDPKYLEDLAKAVSNLNTKGFNLGIIFRKCPVDFSERYQSVIKQYSSTIVEIAPKWESIDNTWDSIRPTKEDTVLLSNTIAHSIFVVNLGSSMVFDYAAFNKACCYINYNQEEQLDSNWDVYQCYRYVHFRSMPEDAVFYFNSTNEIEEKVKYILEHPINIIENAKLWFNTICKTPQQESSKRILESMESIMSKEKTNL